MPVSTDSLTTSYPGITPVRVRSRHAVILPAVQKAYQVMMGALAAEHPHDILHFADRADIQERQEHLKTILDAVATYAEWIVQDTAENAPIGYLSTDSTAHLRDAIADIDADFDRAVDLMPPLHLQAAE